MVQADGRRVRTYTTSLQDNGQVVGTLQVGENLSLVNGALDQLAAALTFGALLLIVLSVAGGYFLAGRALAPVDQITRTVQHISTHDLTARLDLPTGDDELGRLANTLDAMLDRLEEGFRRERQFTADASHELRTPLAAMQAILDVVRARAAFSGRVLPGVGRHRRGNTAAAAAGRRSAAVGAQRCRHCCAGL